MQSQQTQIQQPICSIKPEEKNSVNLQFPMRKNVPQRFFDRTNAYNYLVSSIFYEGIRGKTVSLFKLEPNEVTLEEIDRFFKWWHIQLGNQNYEHNFKIAACAYLFSGCFTIVSFPKDIDGLSLTF